MEKSTTSDRIRAQISEAMEKRRVTQTSLSEQLGMNKSTLKLKLNGDREFKLSELSDIAEILHLILVIGV